MIKDILVHLDGSPRDEERLLHAEAIAVLAQAHVTGLLTVPVPDLSAFIPIDGGAVAADVIAKLDDDARRRGDEAERRLAERSSRLGMPQEIRRLDLTFEGLPASIASQARVSDLFVTSRPYEDDGAEWDRVFEGVLFEGGRAVLVVPPGRPPADSISRVLVCWRDTRECARAVAEALPIIAQATRTIVLLVDPSRSEGEPSADIARHLDRHSARIEVSEIESKGRDIADVMLEHAQRLSADLIVMGGYGHSRMREWLIGGATRDMLSSSPVPILIAH